MGGTGCWYFAMNHPELFSALIPMASIPPAGLDLKIPAYVIHGENDELFPVDKTEQYVQEIRERGGNMKFIMVKGISHYQTSEYAHALQSSVKWLKQVWKDQKRESDILILLLRQSADSADEKCGLIPRSLLRK